MRSVVITGSTRGIGFGLADSFLSLGYGVVISGRTPEGLKKAISRLSEKHKAERIAGCPCDVTDFKQVENLWQYSQKRFGKIDIWINNAGVSHQQQGFQQESPEEIDSLVGTNITGTMYGARVALRGMFEQGAGALYNMEGLGSDGRKVSGLALYGSTKSSVRYLTDSLASEAKDSNVIVGALYPGMVVTEFLTGWYEKGSADWEQAKRIFNILADRVETVTPWLAKKVAANKKNGRRFIWLRKRKIIGRFLTLPFHKRNLFADQENTV